MASLSPHRCQARTDAFLRHRHAQANHLSAFALLPTWLSAPLLPSPSPSPLLSHASSQTQNLHLCNLSPPALHLLCLHVTQNLYNRPASPLLLLSCFLFTHNTPPCRYAICLIPSSPSTTHPFILLCRQHCWPPSLRRGCDPSDTWGMERKCAEQILGTKIDYGP